MSQAAETVQQESRGGVVAKPQARITRYWRLMSEMKNMQNEYLLAFMHLRRGLGYGNHIPGGRWNRGNLEN